MAKTYRPYVPEQDLLLPPSLRDWLPEDHLAYFVSDLIDQLDVSESTAVYDRERRASRASQQARTREQPAAAPRGSHAAARPGGGGRCGGGRGARCRSTRRRAAGGTAAAAA